MEIKENVRMTAEERNSMADKAVSMMTEIEDPKHPNVIAEFGVGYDNEPCKHKGLDYVFVPQDIVDTVIAKFKDCGWFIFFNYTTYEVHKRRLGCKGKYV